MSITLPIWLAVSQWVLLFALGFLVIVMYRQFGVVMQLKDHGTDKDGLPTGHQAPTFEYLGRSNGQGLIPTRFEPKGNWSLLLFADPGCSSCASAVLALESLSRGQIAQTLIVTIADEAQIEAIEAFQQTSLNIARVSHDVPNKLYRIHATPFAYLVNPDGVIHAKGIATDQATLRKILGKVSQSHISTRQEAHAYADN